MTATTHQISDRRPGSAAATPSASSPAAGPAPAMASVAVIRQRRALADLRRRGLGKQLSVGVLAQLRRCGSELSAFSLLVRYCGPVSAAEWVREHRLVIGGAR